MKSSSKIRKSFRNFLISRISKSHKDQEFLDASFQTQDHESILAHKLILASLSPILSQTLLNDGEDAVIILPDFKAEIIRIFVLLSYGLLRPDSIDKNERIEVMELCQVE